MNRKTVEASSILPTGCSSRRTNKAPLGIWSRKATRIVLASLALSIS